MTAPATPSAPVRPPDPPTSTVGAILLIPDNDLRLLVRGVLSLRGHPVLFEIPSLEALDRSARSDRPLLCLVDLGGSTSDWRRALWKVLRHRTELRVVVLVPEKDTELTTEARDGGVRSVVARPVMLSSLQVAIDDALSPGAPRP